MKQTLKNLLVAGQVILVTFLLPALLTCTKTSSREGAQQPDSKRIMTTINPYYLMVKQIVQDKIAVDLFIPANSSPHTFSPAPQDIIKLEKARLVVANGLQLEQQFLARLENIQDKVFYAANCLPPDKLLAFDTQHAHEESTEPEVHNSAEEETGHHHEGMDPHIWLNPENLLLIAGALKARIISLFPEDTLFFDRNWKILEDSLKQIDNEITAERMHYREPALITFHNSFGYFLHKYDIKLAAVIQQAPGKEPTARELMEIGKHLYGVQAIFLEPQLNPRAAEIIAKEYNLRIDTLDPLGFLFKAGSMADILWKNWNVMKKYFTVKVSG